MKLDIKTFIPYFHNIWSPLEGHNVLFNTSATFSLHGGETASTEIKKLWLHTEFLPARKKGEDLNIIADDYNYALAA